MKQHKLVPVTIILSAVLALSATLGGMALKIHATSSQTPQNLTQYVNPFIGTQPLKVSASTPMGGFTFPGADLPFGMVQFSPDTASNSPGGYSYNDTQVNGFSLTHISGTDCNIYQDVPFMPYVGTITSSPGSNPSAYGSSFSHTNEVAQPGYYKVQLGAPSNVQAELTATKHTGFGQFSYPASTSSSMLIYSSTAPGTKNASVTIDSGHQLVTAYATRQFCRTAYAYTIYFAAQFDVPFTKYGIWSGTTVKPGATTTSGNPSGAYVTFTTSANQQVHLRVGVSFVSVAHALANLQAETSDTSSFSSIQSAASSSWNTMLNSVQVSGGSASEMQIFYTSLYHALLFPSTFSDVDGSYIGFDNAVHTVPTGHVQYANYSGWDIYHGLIPLLAMLFPSQTSDMMQSLVNDAQQGGCLPRWSVANVQTTFTDGDSADPIIAEAYAFGATQFDTAAALQAMIKGATQGCTSGTYVERPGLSQYLSQGYVPYGTKGLIGAASSTLEYAADDFAISRFALALGDTTNAATFGKRAENWQNVFNTATGHIEPRNADGTYISGYNPTSLMGFYNDDSVQYSWMVPYNVAGLFSKMGGNANAISRLDKFFTQLNSGPASTNAYMSNEPNSVVPWEYNFAGQPWKTQSTVRRVVTQLYTAAPNGMLNNDDLGEMSAWYIWAALGMFPLYPGIGDVMFNSPLFSQTAITLGTGNVLQINASGAADNAPYVQSLTVNGQSSTQLWQPISTLASGATLQFMLGGAANTSWGTTPASVPPSF